MSTRRPTTHQICHIDPASLPQPQLVFPLRENADSDEFPLDRGHPFVAQEQARRVILAALRDTAPHRRCWLVGLPHCGRHALTAYLASQTISDGPGEDQVLIPIPDSEQPVQWLALPQGTGKRWAKIAEDGLRDWQTELLDASLPLQDTLLRLAENWQELSSCGCETVRLYSRETLRQLNRRAPVLRQRLLSGRACYTDDLETALHSCLWGLLTPNHEGTVLRSGCSARELFGAFTVKRSGPDAYRDHTTFRGGALLQARRRVLIIDGRELADKPQLWTRLRRTLESGFLELGDLADEEPAFPAWGYNLRIPLDAAVFIAISPSEYLKLSESDEDLGCALPYKAEFAEEDWLTEAHKREFSAYAVQLAQACGGPGIAIDGIEALLYYCSQRAANPQRLNLQLGLLDGIMRRSSQSAVQRGASLIKACDIENSLQEKRRSAALLEEELNYYTDGDIIHIETDGRTVGQVNGLTVVEQPEYSFGRPQRITAVVYASKDGLVAVERESQNDGKIHAKGTLILSGYILGCLGGLHTWPIGISVCMEQSYDSIDGDSASSAEAYAVLSALADVPIDQGIAVTGSIDQFGNVQAVGGIAEKVQGFYDLCARRGLTGKQGVIIPRANMPDLLFDRGLREAVRQGRFHIWAVEHVSEGIEILTGLPMGRLRDDRYPKRSIMGKIQMAADEADR